MKPESSSLNDGVSSGELVTLIRRAAKELLGIHYSRPDIPGRMAEIILAFKKQYRITVAELRQITGVSRNTLVRDIKPSNFWDGLSSREPQKRLLYPEWLISRFPIMKILGFVN